MTKNIVSGFFIVLERDEALADGAKRALVAWQRRNPQSATHIFISAAIPLPAQPIIEGLDIHPLKIGKIMVGAGVLA